jgi:hypothetical protein
MRWRMGGREIGCKRRSGVQLAHRWTDLPGLVLLPRPAGSWVIWRGWSRCVRRRRRQHDHVRLLLIICRRAPRGLLNEEDASSPPPPRQNVRLSGVRLRSGRNGQAPSAHYYSTDCIKPRRLITQLTPAKRQRQKRQTHEELQIARFQYDHGC